MATTIHKTDPAGDLILLVGLGDKQVSVRASSKVLMLASPVLNAMLNSSFVEGQALSHKDGTSIPTISLPDDDPEAFTWICDALHFKKLREDSYDFKFLENVAVLCDKYDSRQALAPWIELWLGSWNSSDFERQSPIMLGIAYAFDDQTAFWRVSRYLIRTRTDAGLMDVASYLNNSILPDGVLESMRSARNTTLRALQTMVEAIVTPHLRQLCNCKKNNEMDDLACGHLSRLGHFFQKLYLLNLWPLTSLLAHGKLNMIEQQFLKKFADPKPYSKGEGFPSCWMCTRDMTQDDLVGAAKRAFAQQDGLCLQCVKEGRVSEKRRNCRASEMEGHKTGFNA